jgi:hypothetical protein
MRRKSVAIRRARDRLPSLQSEFYDVALGVALGIVVLVVLAIVLIPLAPNVP